MEEERVSLLASLGTQSIPDNQEQTLIDFAHKVSAGLDCADADLRTRLDILEALRVEAILNQEQGSKTLRIKCVLAKGDIVHYVLSPNILEDLSDNMLKWTNGDKARSG